MHSRGRSVHPGAGVSAGSGHPFDSASEHVFGRVGKACQVEKVLPLIGVLIGGLLTISGQFLQGAIQHRLDARRERDNARVIARLQQDAFWAFQNEAAQALQRGGWPTTALNPTYQPTRDDMRVMAGVLRADEWKVYSSAVRRRVECAQDPADRDLDHNDLLRIMIAYAAADDARHLLAEY